MFHKKNTANLITALFAILLIAQIFGFLLITTNNDLNSANAARGVNPLDKLQIKIPGLDPTKFSQGQEIGAYISSIHRYAIGSVGLLATVVMMYAGMLWITAAGNTEQIGKAKSYLTAALSGTVLALTSWVILYQVNPDLTTFKAIEPVPVDSKKLDNPVSTQTGCCSYEYLKTTTTYASTCVNTKQTYCNQTYRGNSTRNHSFNINAKCVTDQYGSKCSSAVVNPEDYIGCCVYKHGNETRCKDETEISDIQNKCKTYPTNNNGILFNNMKCEQTPGCPQNVSL